MQISYLGSIWHLMAGSGLADLFEIVYAGNTVSHMMTGKAVSRAVRGHLLVDAALSTILVADAYNAPTKDTLEETHIEMTITDRETDVMGTQDTPEDTVQTDLTVARELTMRSSGPMEDVCSAEVFEKSKVNLTRRKRQ